jgi:hypothetical protein
VSEAILLRQVQVYIYLGLPIADFFLILINNGQGYDHVVLLLALIKLDSLIATLRSAISWKNSTKKNLTKKNYY